MGKQKAGNHLRQRGLPYVKETCPGDSILKIGMCWPMPDRVIREFASQVEEIYIVEELDPYIEDSVKALGIAVKGGKDIIPIRGELTPEIVNQALNGKAPERNISRYDEEKIPGRPPQLCAGCPHGFVYQVLSKLDLHVNGDIGCLYSGSSPPLLTHAYTGLHGGQHRHAPGI
jgi:indolepyruvate ferredoxin oxidoreductase alpha subunit